MNDTWICGDCRSLNPARQKRCYRCRAPRSTSEMTEASAAFSSASAQKERTVLAAASRIGARYRPTWPLAILVMVTVVIAAAISIDQINAVIDVLRAGSGINEDDPRFQRALSATIAMLIALTVSVAAWSLWIAIVVANVPALVARWPPHSPIGAFFAPFIPIIGFKRPYSVIRGVLATISAGGAGQWLVVLAWWLTFLATYFGPTVVLVLDGAFANDESQGSIAALTRAVQFRQFLLVPAAGLALGVVLIVELQQQRALRRRARVVMAV